MDYKTIYSIVIRCIPDIVKKTNKIKELKYTLEKEKQNNQNLKNRIYNNSISNIHSIRHSIRHSIYPRYPEEMEQ